VRDDSREKSKQLHPESELLSALLCTNVLVNRMDAMERRRASHAQGAKRVNMQSAAHPSASMEMVSEMGKRDEGMREQGSKMVNSVYKLPLLLLRTCSSEGRCSLRKDVGDRFLRSPGFAWVVAGRGALRCSWCSFGHAERICSRLRMRCELDDDDSWGRAMDRSESLGAVSLPKVDLRLVTRFCTLVSHSPYSTSTRSQTYAQALAAPLQNARTPRAVSQTLLPFARQI